MSTLGLLENLSNNYNVCYDMATNTAIPVTGTEPYYKKLNETDPVNAAEFGTFTTGCTSKKGVVMPCCDKTMLEELKVPDHVQSVYGKVDEFGDVTFCPHRISPDIKVESCGFNNECIQKKCKETGHTLKLNPYQICQANGQLVENRTKYQTFGFNDCNALLNKEAYVKWQEDRKEAYKEYLKTVNPASPVEDNVKMGLIYAAIGILLLLVVGLGGYVLFKSNKKANR